MRLELDALCNEIARNSVLKVVILTGEGRGFCAGGDLTSEGAVLGAFEGSSGIEGPYKELAEYFLNDLRHRVLQSAMRKLEDLPQPTIAAVNGPAVGVGPGDDHAVRHAHSLGPGTLRRGGGAGGVRSRKWRLAQPAQARGNRAGHAPDPHTATSSTPRKRCASASWTRWCRTTS